MAPHFPTTRWSLIFGGRERTSRHTEARESLGELCQIYWRPIFGFVRASGYPESEAQDLTQDFIVYTLTERLLNRADPERGRFRSLLLKSLKHFLIDKRKKARRRKHGGSFDFIPWEDWDSNISVWETSKHAYADHAEAVFDIQWAATITEEALRSLREECESKGHHRLFELLSPYLDTDRAEICYKAIAAALEMPPQAVKHLLHEFRKRFRTLLRHEVARTINDKADLDEEVRYLCAVLSLAGT